MSRRYKCDDYPEHLNPFHETYGDEEHIQNKYNTGGRRRSRTALNLASWPLFQTMKTKPAERDGTYFQRSSRTFMSMTPKISRHFAEILSSKRSTRPSKSVNAETVSNGDKSFSPSEFRIRPKSSREKFALRPETDRGADMSSPAPSESEVAPVVPRSRSLERLHTPTSADYKEFDFSEEGIKCTSHGAKPKKKRQAPLPPPSPTSSAPSDQDDKELPSTPKEYEMPVELDKH